MRIFAEKERPADAFLLAICRDGLGNGDDMGLIEAVSEGRSSMAGGAKGNPLRWLCYVGTVAVVSRNKLGDVN